MSASTILPPISVLKYSKTKHIQTVEMTSQVKLNAPPFIAQTFLHEPDRFSVFPVNWLKLQ